MGRLWNWIKKKLGIGQQTPPPPPPQGVAAVSSGSNVAAVSSGGFVGPVGPPPVGPPPAGWPSNQPWPPEPPKPEPPSIGPAPSAEEAARRAEAEKKQKEFIGLGDPSEEHVHGTFPGGGEPYPVEPPVEP